MAWDGILGLPCLFVIFGSLLACEVGCKYSSRRGLGRAQGAVTCKVPGGGLARATPQYVLSAIICSYVHLFFWLPMFFLVL